MRRAKPVASQPQVSTAALMHKLPQIPTWTRSSVKAVVITRASSFDFSRYEVVSETLRNDPDEAVMGWLVRFDAELALPTVTIAEIAFGI